MDGTESILLVNKAPLLDQNHNVVGMIANAVDITVRKCNKCKYNDIKIYLKNILSTMSGSIYWKDKKGV